MPIVAKTKWRINNEINLYDSGRAVNLNPDGYNISFVSPLNKSKIDPIDTTLFPSENKTIFVSHNRYTIYTNIGAGGTINPIGPVRVDHGGTRTFTIVPDFWRTPGDLFRILSVNGCNGSLTINNTIGTYITGPVTEDCWINVEFTYDEARCVSVEVKDQLGQVSYQSLKTFSPVEDTLLKFIAPFNTSINIKIEPFTGYQFSHILDWNNNTITPNSTPGWTMSGDVLMVSPIIRTNQDLDFTVVFSEI